jgi:hypothetical protein
MAYYGPTEDLEGVKPQLRRLWAGYKQASNALDQAFQAEFPVGQEIVWYHSGAQGRQYEQRGVVTWNNGNFTELKAINHRTGREVWVRLFNNRPKRARGQ